MKRIRAFALALTLLLSVSCSGKNPQGPTFESLLRVYVYYGEHGVGDRRVEIVELGIEKITDAAGNADFALPAGKHTVRAYLNRGGPGFRPEQVEVRTTPGRRIRVEFWDCAPCLAPS
jgi:hypothetical protein